jgi:hypothetical protein
VLWYAKAAVDNPGNYATMLRQLYWRMPALQPEMKFISKNAPSKPRKLKPVRVGSDYVLFWTAPKAKKWDEEATEYAVYRFNKGEKVNIDDASHLIAITRDTFLQLPYATGKQHYTYVVTSLNRLHSESKIAKKKVKL